MYELIEQVVDDNLQPKSPKINFIFDSLGFIEPSGITVLSNITHWLIYNNVKVRYSCPPHKEFIKNKSLRFLDDSQYFKHYLKKTIRENAAVRGTTIPLELVRLETSYQWSDKVAQWLAGKIRVNVRSLADIKMCLLEIFNNISDHSKQQIGSAFIQHYPSKNTVSIAISDFGVGIPYNIKKSFPQLSDAEAIEKATERGFSTKSTPRNRGAGLDTLINNVVKNNGGDVYIHSNCGILNCIYANDDIKLKNITTSVFYPGTLIEINLRTDTIENILEEEEDYEW
jgi:anti-sigma regulatory factor (Ser/Thr protein kinase)